MKLTIELVPTTSWYNNVRSQVSRPVWDLLRKDCYRKAKHKCEICGLTGLVQGFKWPVECHEIWEYDDKNHTQTLTGLIALCPWCHKVKHAGRTITVDNQTELVVRQLMKVNNMNRHDAEVYIFNALALHNKRSRFSWTVDISILNGLIAAAKENLCPIQTSPV
jgi:hypothetical protein